MICGRAWNNANGRELALGAGSCWLAGGTKTWEPVERVLRSFSRCRFSGRPSASNRVLPCQKLLADFRTGLIGKTEDKCSSRSYNRVSRAASRFEHFEPLWYCAAEIMGRWIHVQQARRETRQNNLGHECMSEGRAPMKTSTASVNCVGCAFETSGQVLLGARGRCVGATGYTT